MAWLSFGVLLIVAAGVFLLLPESIQHQPPNGFESEAISTGPAVSRPMPEESTSPPRSQAQADSSRNFIPEQRTKSEGERAQVEEALAKLLRKQAALKDRGVDLWGGQQFEAAKIRIAAGDASFVDQAYGAAANAYARAAKILDELIGRADDVLNAAVKAGGTALANRNSGRATAKFKLALAIDSNSTLAREGLARARSLDDIERLLNAGARLETKGAWQAAVAKYERALKLDPASESARDALDQAHERIAEHEFKQAMSEGFMALEQGDFETAREAFRTAGTIRPDSAEVADGLAQLDMAIRLQEIAAHRDQATRLEQQEDWQEALEHYRAALELDPNLVFAKQGQIRALGRAQLAQQLDFHIQHPERLSSGDVYAQAVSTRNLASEIESQGPRLRQQIADLSRLLMEASTPVRVRLESDNVTEVVVYNVGQLGTFETRELKLRPGEYTAVGSRDGYRDVRREFQVVAGEIPAPVVVRCEEQI
jgi:tetratricopeptide (TPR) repeat protein